MGEHATLFTPGFNHSVHVESRPQHLSGDCGALLLRDVLERLGLTDWLVARLRDRRRPDLITHPLGELLRTALVLLAQGWRDQDDADTLRDDPLLRLAVSSRRGLSPLRSAAAAQVPDGLASQPTLSRLVDMLGSTAQRAVLRKARVVGTARRLKAQRRGHRQRYLTLDIDSLPIPVYGHQPQSQYNGHYHARIYHPLVATAAELGDLLDVQLRPGAAHTTAGARDFVLPLLDRVEAQLCQVAAVRLGAGFPEERLLSALEGRRTPYVARVRNNAALDRLAAPFLHRPPGRPPAEPRTWTYELTYRAETSCERVDELFLHHSWVITNWTTDQLSGHDLLAEYRQRGTA